MTTLVRPRWSRVSIDAPDPAVIAEAAAVLRQGGLVVFPTETVYGVGAHADDPSAVARLCEAKGRPADKPLTWHLATVEAARAVPVEWPPAAQALARR
ncbi:MAG: Sua5/YciO/YrdC/YwlC family protein, partial [Candidatus Omnitrophica bacterium]|nr:Sua5/YciO/YrdC/YwlC family protein [Candidatus Omnitrophota bacterium]